MGLPGIISCLARKPSKPMAGISKNSNMPNGPQLRRPRRKSKTSRTHGKKISAVSLTISAQVGKDDKMFGSVTAKDIAEGLAEQGFTVDRRKIQLAQPIKELGTFAIAIKLPREVTATIAVHVVKKQEEPEAAAPTA